MPQGLPGWLDTSFPVKATFIRRYAPGQLARSEGAGLSVSQEVEIICIPFGSPTPTPPANLGRETRSGDKEKFLNAARGFPPSGA